MQSVCTLGAFSNLHPWVSYILLLEIDRFSYPEIASEPWNMPEVNNRHLQKLWTPGVLMDTDSDLTIGKNARNCPKITMSAPCPLRPAGGTCVGKPYSTLRPPTGFGAPLDVVEGDRKVDSRSYSLNRVSLYRNLAPLA
jgi:hypothetical protein